MTVAIEHRLNSEVKFANMEKNCSECGGRHLPSFDTRGKTNGSFRPFISGAMSNEALDYMHESSRDKTSPTKAQKAQ